VLPAVIQVVIDPYIEATQSAFLGLNVSLNTATLWGRRVHQVAVSENVLFALSDTGEVFTWGGNSYWWVGYAVFWRWMCVGLCVGK
jgi:hypothetical protein